MPVSFHDTNVLLYLASGEAAKADRVEQVLREGGNVSVQVLNEVANISRRKMHMSWTETRSFLSALRSLLSVHTLTTDTHELGVSLAEQQKLSIYDAMIVASALQAGCNVLWSEDMHHGLLVRNRLRIINPFRPPG